MQTRNYHFHSSQYKLKLIINKLKNALNPKSVFPSKSETHISQYTQICQNFKKLKQINKIMN